MLAQSVVRARTLFTRTKKECTRADMCAHTHTRCTAQHSIQHTSITTRHTHTVYPNVCAVLQRASPRSHACVHTCTHTVLMLRPTSRLALTVHVYACKHICTHMQTVRCSW